MIFWPRTLAVFLALYEDAANVQVQILKMVEEIVGKGGSIGEQSSNIRIAAVRGHRIGSDGYRED